MDDLCFRPAVDLAAAVRAGTVTSRDLVEAYLDRIARHNSELNAVVTVDADGARRAADAADRLVADGAAVGPLHGVPMTVKDAFETVGLRTTTGSTDRADHVPDGDAEAVARLRRAGVVILGKTNLPEGATGQETGNALFGRTVNPWDGDRTPGGSSGGAAAAVAAGLTGLELGSDSGGSIRQPAHCCGIYGHFPTHGLVPVRGHVPLVGRHELDLHIDLMAVGPLARSADDLAVALDVLAGPDAPRAAGWRLELPPAPHDDLRDYRVGVWLDPAACPTDSAVLGRIEAAADALAAAGVDVRHHAGPDFDAAEASELAFTLWAASTAVSTDDDEWERLAKVAAGADRGEGLAVRRARAETLPLRSWQHLHRRRRAYERAWAAVFDDVDVVLCPVSPVLAVPHDPEPALVHDHDRRIAATITVDGAERPYLDQLTWNILIGMARLPSTVAPVGVAGGLPVGVQVVGPHLGDRTTLDVAARMATVVGGYRPPPPFAPAG